MNTRTMPKAEPFLVTGASRGIGRAICRMLSAKYKAHVVAVGRDEEALEELISEIEALGGTAQSIGVDVAISGAAEAIRTHLPEHGLRGLVHCAGVCALGSVEEISAEVLDRHWQVNLRAPFLLTAQLLPELRRRKGHVVFINSGAGKVAKAQWSAYAATKHGLKALADSLREEVAPSGVRVTSVYPGRTATDMQASVRTYEGRAYDPGDWVQPEDIAEAVMLALTTPMPALVEEVSVRPMPR